jgi:hypothetical protein
MILPILLQQADERFVYAGERLLQIAMPLGGIGSGYVCLNGYGGLQDFSIRHHPQLTASPDRHLRTDAAFAPFAIFAVTPSCVWK